MKEVKEAKELEEAENREKQSKLHRETEERVDYCARAGKETGAVHSEDGYAFIGYGAGERD